MSRAARDPGARRALARRAGCALLCQKTGAGRGKTAWKSWPSTRCCRRLRRAFARSTLPGPSCSREVRGASEMSTRRRGDAVKPSRPGPSCEWLTLEW